MLWIYLYFHISPESTPGKITYAQKSFRPWYHLYLSGNIALVMLRTNHRSTLPREESDPQPGGFRPHIRLLFLKKDPFPFFIHAPGVLKSPSLTSYHVYVHSPTTNISHQSGWCALEQLSSTVYKYSISGSNDMNITTIRIPIFQNTRIP